MLTNKQIKPSQLPCYATIETKKGRLFMRDSNGAWSLLFAKDAAEADRFDITPEYAEHCFGNFKVVAVPVGWDETPYLPFVEEETDLEQWETELVTWRDVPGFPSYETTIALNKVFVRNKKSGAFRKRRENGFFVLYQNGKKNLWCEGELGTSYQIDYFYKTGVVGVQD